MTQNDGERTLNAHNHMLHLLMIIFVQVTASTALRQTDLCQLRSHYAHPLRQLDPGSSVSAYRISYVTHREECISWQATFHT